MSEKMQNATMRINLITVFSVFWNDRSIILLSILSFLGCGLIFNEFGRSTYVSTTPIKDGATAIGNLHFGLINTYLKASEDELIDPNHVASPGFTEQSVHTNYLRELSRLLERDFASRIGDKVNPLARNVRLEKKSQAGWFVLAETKNSAAWLQRLERIDQEMSAIMLQKIMRQVQAIHVQQDIARGFKIEELDVKKKSIIELEKKLNERKATSHHGAVNELDGSSEKIPSGGYPIRKKDQNENGLKNDENAIVLAMETFRHDLRRIVGPEAQIIWLEQKKHEIAIEIERLQHLADADNLGLMVREVVLDYDGRFRFGAIDVENSEFKHALNAKVVLLCFSIIGALFGGLFSVFRNAELLREKALTGDYYS